MKIQMNRTRDVSLVFALALVVSAAAWAQYLGPVGSFHTPMQNQLRAPPGAGISSVPQGSPSAFGCCNGMTARDRNNMATRNSYLPTFNITGRDMATYAVGRGLTRGMRF